jgi:hypothetical protein
MTEKLKILEASIESGEAEPVKKSKGNLMNRGIQTKKVK